MNWRDNGVSTFSVVFGPIRLILAGNVGIHTILKELECRPDPMTEYRVSCPLASKN